MIAKARTYERGFPWFLFDIALQFQEQGPDYLTALLQGYEEPPKGVEVPAGKYYNKYFPGHIISMPQPLNDGQVEYPKDANGRPQAPETVAQYAKDVTAFLMWAAEPHLEARKELGFKTLAFLLVLRRPPVLHQAQDLVEGRGPRPRLTTTSARLREGLRDTGALFRWRHRTTAGKPCHPANRPYSPGEGDSS